MSESKSLVLRNRSNGGLEFILDGVDLSYCTSGVTIAVDTEAIEGLLVTATFRVATHDGVDIDITDGPTVHVVSEEVSA